ncbi:transmembrane protein 17B-like [Takifugu rubripes]|uniref:Transmembrane protein 17 n=1 Tax=Takifugu rubripes TaxID=31033 RepID=A0A674P414_TAKRU|nr:transmembrane protein 17B-like [Takifugu rubripes]|eukprot:XP_003967432.2 PREDICTED: transmembrane protein 17B-like [Takifugu rubripes]
MELPETFRKPLEYISRNVLFDQARPFIPENDTLMPHDKRVHSSLKLQMSLYFNTWYFPFWWISESVMLHVKYPALSDPYKFILITILILMTLIETIRLFLGYSGNLQEKVPELAGFWLLTILQLAIILFQLFYEAFIIQPLERGVHIVLALFILTQAFFGFVALREMVRQTQSQFRLRQFEF